MLVLYLVIEFRMLGISPKNIRGLIGKKSYFCDLKLRNFFKIFEVSSPRLSLLLLFIFVVNITVWQIKDDDDAEL